MATIINANTKRGQAMISNAKRSEGEYLYEIYDSYSSAKYKAWLDCWNMYHNENGENFHITSHNSFGFSVAWDTKDGLRIETPNNSYLVR